jgi:ParB/RepB/Spo0J family partition protein
VSAPFVFLHPSQLKTDPQTDHARPGPAPADEDQSIGELATELLEIGQIVPLVVEQRADGYYVIEGRRRMKAGLAIETDDATFELACAVCNVKESDPLQLAIHANLKRRGYSPLQMAHLCKVLRELHKWEGTKEVAAYLRVSRALVSQHDKLLQKPEGMEETVYQGLLAKLSSGQMGSDAAFYALTQVQPAKAGKVLERAGEIARTAVEPPKEAEGLPSTAPGAPSQPAGQESRETRSGKRRGRPKTIRTPEWMKEQHKKHEERVAKAKIEKKHLKQAAKEEKALKDDKPLQKTLPELRKMFEVLRGSAYPDVMRGFISVLADAWWRGDASDREVISHWSQIAMLVEQQIDKLKKTKPAAAKKPAPAKKAPAKKAVKPAPKKKKSK